MTRTCLTCFHSSSDSAFHSLLPPCFSLFTTLHCFLESSLHLGLLAWSLTACCLHLEVFLLHVSRCSCFHLLRKNRKTKKSLGNQASSKMSCLMYLSVTSLPVILQQKQACSSVYRAAPPFIIASRLCAYHTSYQPNLLIALLRCLAAMASEGSSHRFIAVVMNIA